MEIRCRCSQCEAKFKADEASAGLKIACPRCGGTVMVPPVARAIEDPTSEAVPQVAAAPQQTAMMAPAVASEGGSHPNPWPLRIGLGALGLVAIGAMLFMVYLVNRPERPTAVMVHWPMAERKEGAFLEVSGNTIDLAKKDTFLVHVAPGPHRVTFRRKGYEPVVWNFTLVKGEQKELTPEWKPGGEIAKGK